MLVNNFSFKCYETFDNVVTLDYSYTIDTGVRNAATVEQGPKLYVDDGETCKLCKCISIRASIVKRKQ